ncbi:hypothetical protein Mapa_013098 [Marchantia paleacea]|nr:hypothetical protein Mapa_013098 [Marchantia paleacea]
MVLHHVSLVSSFFVATLSRNLRRCISRWLKFVLAPWVAVEEVAHVADWMNVYCSCCFMARALVL